MKKKMHILAFLFFIMTAAVLCLYRCFSLDVFLSLTVTFGTCFYHLFIRLLAGTAFDRAFHNKLDFRLRWFMPLPFEERLYKFLKVKAWKKHLPTYAPQNFDLRNHSFEEVLGSMCQAEAVHEINIVLSFLPLFMTKYFGAFYVFLITSILAAAFDMLFVIIERYNRPRVMLLAEAFSKRKGLDF